METDFDSSVVLFDGVCNLCSGAVQFIIKRDKKKQFRFASLQSGFGQQVLRHFNFPPDWFDSFILLEKGRIYTKSTGALRVVKKLGGLWPLLHGLIIIPPFIRNGVYTFIGRHRYRWFGKQDSCWLPTPDLKARFLT